MQSNPFRRLYDSLPVYNDNKAIDTLFCELLKDLSRYQIVIATLKHNNPYLAKRLFGRFPFLDRAADSVYCKTLRSGNAEQTTKLLEKLINDICDSAYMQLTPSKKILQAIIYTGFPLPKLYMGLKPKAQDVLCSILPAISHGHFIEIDSDINVSKKFADSNTFDTVHIPVVYQGLLYDFDGVMKYIIKCNEQRKVAMLGYAHGNEIDLNKLQLDYELLLDMRATAVGLHNNKRITLSSLRYEYWNNYLKPAQHNVMIKWLRYIRGLSFKERMFYLAGISIISKVVLDSVYFDIRRRFPINCEAINNTAVVRNEIDLACIFQPNMLENFRMIPIYLSILHTLMNATFHRQPNEEQERYHITEILVALLPGMYIVNMDRWLFQPVTRSHKEWNRCVSVDEFAPASWWPSLVISVPVFIINGLTLAMIKNFSDYQYEDYILSRNNLNIMLGCMIGAKIQNLITENYAKRNALRKDTEEEYVWMIFTASVLLFLFNFAWKFYFTPTLNFSLDVGSKLLNRIDERHCEQEEQDQTLANEILGKMHEVSTMRNPKVPFKEGLFFWQRNIEGEQMNSGQSSPRLTNEGSSSPRPQPTSL